MIDKQVLELKKLWANKRQLTFQLLNLAMIVFSALMIWKGLMFLTKVTMTLIMIVEGSNCLLRFSFGFSSPDVLCRELTVSFAYSFFANNNK